MKLDISKNGRCIIQFKKLGMLSVKSVHLIYSKDNKDRPVVQYLHNLLVHTSHCHILPRLWNKNK